MRFHLGVSMNIKKLFKYILPILIGLACYFGIFQIQVLALPSGEDLLGYYVIDDTKDTSCNIFTGSYESLNISTNQVETNIDYPYANIALTQTGAVGNAGWQTSNMIIRYERNTTQQLYLSFKIGNGGDIDACSGRYEPSNYTADNCNAPVVQVYYCPTDDGDMTSSSCYKNDVNNSSTRDIYNYAFKTNAWINNYKSTTDLDYKYIYILLPNYSYTTYGHLPIGKGWNFDYILSDTSVDSNAWDDLALNYCEGVDNGPGSGGGNSVIEDVQSAITNTLTGPNGVLLDPTLPNINIGVFNDLKYDNTSISNILYFPIDLLNVIVQNKDTCTPVSFNLSSLTRAFGGNDYVLTFPCIRNTVKNLIGTTWYNVFDLMIAGILFYYFCCNLILKINDLLSGVDGMPYFYTSSSKNRTTKVGTYDKSTGEVIT